MYLWYQCAALSSTLSWYPLFGTERVDGEQNNDYKERPSSKLSPFALNMTIVADLGSDWIWIVEFEKEAQNTKPVKVTKLSLTMDCVILIIVSPHYILN